jgi:hypothetical protein
VFYSITLNTQSPAIPSLVGQAIVFCGLPTQLRGGASVGPHYLDGVAAGAPLVFFTGFLAFLTGFLVLAVAVAACGELPLVAGVAGVACANVKGIVATARAIASKLVFIFPSFRRVSSARSQFHVAP